MKESIGGASLFFIVIVIMSIFAIYIAISLNWSTAYKVKDEILFYIESNNGFNDQAIADIKKYTANVGYSSNGYCPTEKNVPSECWKGVSLGTVRGTSVTNDAINYCVKKMYYVDTEGMPKRAYYAIKVFFQLDVPIISSMNVGIEGETKAIFQPTDSRYFPFDEKKCVVK